MKKPLVSIIITTYNRPELLKRALKNVLNQTFKNYEIIVIDDCGESKLHLPKKVKYIRHKTNKGLSAARNTGIKSAKGKYIVFLDDDNELNENFLLETLTRITLPTIDAVGVGRIIKYIDFDDYVIPKTDKLSSMDWGWLINKKVFDKIKYDENLKANEDTDFGIQFHKAGFNRIVIHKPLSIAYDINDPKLSLSFPNERELEGMRRFFSKNWAEYDNPKEQWYLCRLMARKFYRGGIKDVGLKFMWKGFKMYKNPRSFFHWFFLLFGWSIYDKFMTLEEKIGSKLR